MSLVKNNTTKLQYEDPKGPSKVTKSGIRIISEMSTPRIANYVMYRHRVGLLGLSTFTLLGYIVYDKVVQFF